jgi:hypothetical protein
MSRSFAAKATTPGTSLAFVAARSIESMSEIVARPSLAGGPACALGAQRPNAPAAARRAAVFTMSRRFGRWIMRSVRIRRVRFRIAQY